MNPPSDKPLYSGLSAETKNKPSPLEKEGQFYKIRIKGQLSDIWADWFEGLTIDYLDTGEMLLSGYIVDQSALMGILNKLVRLNLTLISLNEIKNTRRKNEYNPINKS